MDIVKEKILHFMVPLSLFIPVCCDVHHTCIAYRECTKLTTSQRVSTQACMCKVLVTNKTGEHITLIVEVLL